MCVLDDRELSRIENREIENWVLRIIKCNVYLIYSPTNKFEQFESYALWRFISHIAINIGLNKHHNLPTTTAVVDFIEVLVEATWIGR